MPQHGSKPDSDGTEATPPNIIEIGGCIAPGSIGGLIVARAKMFIIGNKNLQAVPPADALVHTVK